MKLDELIIKGSSGLTPQETEALRKFLRNLNGQGRTQPRDYYTKAEVDAMLKKVDAASLQGKKIGTSGSAIPLLSGANEWSGEFKLVGSATGWLDEKGQLTGARITSPSADITQEDAEGAFAFDDACTLVDYLWMNIQLNHDRKTGAVVSPHLHWWQASATVPNWMIQYRWQVPGIAKVTSWTSVKYSTHAATYSAGTIHQITDFTDLTPPAGDNVSTILQVRIIRDTDNDSTLFAGADGLVGDVYAVDFDIHKEVNSIGSREEYKK